MEAAMMEVLRLRIYQRHDRSEKLGTMNERESLRTENILHLWPAPSTVHSSINTTENSNPI